MATHGQIKHREIVFQRICAEIRRETCDMNTLAAAASRALSHPDVCGDAELSGMVRGFIASRESELRVAAAERGAENDSTQIWTAFAPRKAAQPTDVAAIVLMLDKAKAEFDERAAQLDEVGAKRALARIRDISERHSAVVNRTSLLEADRRMATLRKQCDFLREHIDDLAAQAAEAAAAGDRDKATWALRRLSAINALRPALLCDGHYAEIRQQIERGARTSEHRDAARELLQRERAVAREIRDLATAIRGFHQAARRQPADAEEYRKAEEAYRRAVAEVRSRDVEWMAGLVLELNQLVDEAEDASGKTEIQVDQFIISVRDSLLRLRQEISGKRSAADGGRSPSPTG